MPDASNLKHDIDFSRIPAGTKASFWLPIISSGLGTPIRLPVMLAKGVNDGPVLGLTAAIHGNELNGIPVIQKLFRELDPQQLCGAIVGVPVMNVPGFTLRQRRFNDGVDLNRIAPGKPDGSISQVYIYRLIQNVLRHFDYLIDLHTASAGRVNSWYIRADMSMPATARMARLQNPDIILDNPPNDGTFRGAAAQLGINAVTLELCDPSVFQRGVIAEGLIGIRNVLYDLGMLPGDIVSTGHETILCSSSKWIYTDEGGILQVLPELRQQVLAGSCIAEVRSVFGDLEQEYLAPYDGIVIGKSISPINPTGSRILHLGANAQVLDKLLA